jgi:hypothetical protein
MQVHWFSRWPSENKFLRGSLDFIEDAGKNIVDGNDVTTVFVFGVVSWVPNIELRTCRTRRSAS